MITPAFLRNTIFILLWIVLLFGIYQCQKHEYLCIEGHYYEKFTTPQGETILTHVDSCGCTTKFEGKQFEFKN